MLAWMLLEHHNTHHMQRFMAAVRKSISDGTFQRLKSTQQSARVQAYDAAA
jgi:queuine/archaeosine tRNA-ribosyltransferase